MAIACPVDLWKRSSAEDSIDPYTTFCSTIASWEMSGPCLTTPAKSLRWLRWSGTKESV
jgi:hypothetical protein